MDDQQDRMLRAMEDRATSRTSSMRHSRASSYDDLSGLPPGSRVSRSQSRSASPSHRSPSPHSFSFNGGGEADAREAAELRRKLDRARDELQEVSVARDKAAREADAGRAEAEEAGRRVGRLEEDLAIAAAQAEELRAEVDQTVAEHTADVAARDEAIARLTAAHHEAAAAMRGEHAAALAQREALAEREAAKLAEAAERREELEAQLRHERSEGAMLRAEVEAMTALQETQAAESAQRFQDLQAEYQEAEDALTQKLSEAELTLNTEKEAAEAAAAAAAAQHAQEMADVVAAHTRAQQDMENRLSVSQSHAQATSSELQGMKQAATAAALRTALADRSLLRRAWRDFKAGVRASRRMAALHRAAVGTGDRGVLQRAWVRLKWTMRRRKTLRRILDIWNRREVTHSFERWARYTALQRKCGKMFLKCQATCSAQLLAQAWEGWAMHTQHCALLQPEQSRHWPACDAHHKAYSLKAAMRHWIHLYVTRVKPKLGRYRKAVRVHVRNSSRAALRAWHAQATWLRRIKACGVRGVLLQTATSLGWCFERWAEETAEARAVRICTAKAKRFWNRLVSRNALYTWVAAVDDARCQQAVLSRAVGLLHGLLKGMLFRDWRDYTGVRRHKAARMHRAAVACRKRDLARGLAAWQQYIAWVHRCRNMRRDHDAALVGAHLRAWRGSTQESVWERKLAQRCDRVEARRHRSLCSAVLLTWKSIAQTRARKRVWQAHIAARVTLLSLRRSFATWRDGHLSSLLATRHQLRASVTQLTAKLDSSHSSNRAACERVEALQAAEADLTAQLEAEQADKASAQASSETAHAALKSLEEEALTALATARADAQATEQQLQAALEEVAARLTQRETAETDALQELDKMRAARQDDLKEAQAAAERNETSLEAARSEAAATAAQLEDSQAQVAALEEVLKQSSARMEDIQQQIESEAAANAEAAASTAARNAEALSKAQRRTHDLEEQLSAAQNVTQHHQKQQRDQERLIRMLHLQINEQTVTIRQHDSVVSVLRGQLAETQAEIDRKSAMLSALEQDNVRKSMQLSRRSRQPEQSDPPAGREPRHSVDDAHIELQDIKARGVQLQAQLQAARAALSPHDGATAPSSAAHREQPTSHSLSPAPHTASPAASMPLASPATGAVREGPSLVWSWSPPLSQPGQQTGVGEGLHPDTPRLSDRLRGSRDGGVWREARGPSHSARLSPSGPVPSTEPSELATIEARAGGEDSAERLMATARASLASLRRQLAAPSS